MADSLDIDELATRHVYSHPNDKSGYYLSVMRGRWGQKAAKEAITRAEDVRAMVDPEFADDLKWRRIKEIALRNSGLSLLNYASTPRSSGKIIAIDEAY